MPGTQILLADGTRKAIDKITLEDSVAAADPVSGKLAEEAVVRTIVGRGLKDLVDITVSATSVDGVPKIAKITATSGHPFYLSEVRQWVDAGELREGDRLTGANAGQTATVRSILHRSVRATVYNLTVRAVHTYYVLAGAVPVLVHNSGCGEDVYALEDHVAPRHLPGGAQADATKSLFSADADLGRLATGSAGQIGHFQKETGNIRYFIKGKGVVGADRR